MEFILIQVTPRKWQVAKLVATSDYGPPGRGILNVQEYELVGLAKPKSLAIVDLAVERAKKPEGVTA